MLGPLPYRLFINPRFGSGRIASLPDVGFQRARAEISSWDGYERTPLRDLPALAAQAGLGAIRLKDEATRFGLGSFKALGGAYGVACVLATALGQRSFRSEAVSAELAKGGYHGVTEGITVTCATDGNHGRAVAWGAQRFHCRCVIFVHGSVSQGRVDAIARYGAALDACFRPGGRWRCCCRRLSAHTGAISARFGVARSPVGPDRAACLLASAEVGQPIAVPGNLDTLMAGLACGEPSQVAWQELNHSAAAFMAIPDEAAVACMGLLAGLGIVGGESGVAGLAGCLLASSDPGSCELLGLDVSSRVLAFITEGAIDPESYERLVGICPNRLEL